MYSTDHNKILHMSWHVQNLFVIGWAYFKLEHVLQINFDRIANLIEIPLVELAPDT